MEWEFTHNSYCIGRTGVGKIMAYATQRPTGTLFRMDDLNLSDLRSVHQVLERTPLGEGIAELAERIGLVTEQIHRSSVVRKKFQANVSKLSAPQLSDEQSYWASEYGRIVELLGILQGQEKYLGLKSKAARAAARARLRRNAEEEPAAKTTSAQINDAAEEDPVVRELDERAAIVNILLASAAAAKEATTIYLQTLSREITFRCAQMDSRLH